MLQKMCTSICLDFLCARGNERSKGMIYFLQTLSKYGHSFAMVNELNIYVLIKKKKNVVIHFFRDNIRFDLPLFATLTSPSFPSIFVLLFSFRSRFISKLLLLSVQSPRLCSSSELLLFSNEFSSDCFVSEFSFSSVVNKLKSNNG